MEDSAIKNYRANDARISDPLDWLCVRFALSMVLRLGAKFNLRRDINDVLNLAGRHFVWPEANLQRLQKFIAARCAEHDAFKGVGDLPNQAFIDKFAVWNGTYDDATVFYYIDEYVKQNSKELLAVFKATVDDLDAKLAQEPIKLVDNIRTLAKVLSLNDSEQAVLLHASLCKYQRDLRPILVDCKVQSANEAFQMLAEVINRPASELSACLRYGSRLEMLGLIDTPIADHNITDLGDLMRVSDRLLPILMASYVNDAAMMAVFTRPAKASQLTVADYPHIATEMHYLTALIKAACQKQEQGINVLIYGPPGTGKTEFAKLLAKNAEAELYEVDCIDRDGNSLTGKERYRALQVSQAFLRGRSNTALLFDEVEDVFPTMPRELMNVFAQEHDNVSSGGSNGKAWVNQTLENNPVPTIWISNSIGQIDPAYRRRFQFHLEIANPPPNVREKIMRKHLSGFTVSEPFVQKLAARKSLTPAQIQSAARFATLTSGQMQESVEELILKQIDYSDKALGVKADEGARRIVTNYNLDLCNIESRYPLDKMLKALGTHARGTLCFYGPPGTGKTALAEHIAKSLDKPLLIKRASDLLSKYVGETEQQMASMFAEAKSQKAVLLLDEADSFLQNRGLAQRNYEVSEVNEMLQGMERHDGVFICTTNLFERIDEAALRRFTFKIKFMPLSHEQREKMFVNEALAGDATHLNEAMKHRLSKLQLLTPGDFATVKRQVELFDEGIPASDFLAQLEQEHQTKPDIRYSRHMGFN